MTSPLQAAIAAALKPKSTKVSWEEQVLAGIGAPLSVQNVKFLDAWQAKEGTAAANNPLATTRNATGATPLQGNPAGVKNYPDAATGIQATIDSLKGFPAIVAAFKSGDAAQYVSSDSSAQQAFGTWVNGYRKNAADPAAWDKGASDYINGIYANIGKAGPLQLSTPGASAVQAKATATSVSEQQLKDAQRALNDPYVTKQGGISRSDTFDKSIIPSNIHFGEGMRQSEFDALANNYSSVYFSYTGKPLTPTVLAQLAQQPKSIGYLKQNLANLPGFTQSPEWQTKAPEYIAAARGLYGAGYTPPTALLKKAITTGVSTGAFQDQLRQLPEYEQSDGFQKATSALSVSYQNIYGTPDENGHAVVVAAAKNGWDPNQFEQYLRAQPAYTQSNEYQTKTLKLLGALGLITGGTPVLSPGESTVENPNSTGLSLQGSNPQNPQVGPPAGVYPTGDNTLHPVLVGSKVSA